MGRRLVVLIVVAGFGLSVLATAAAPHVSARHAVPLADSAVWQSVQGDLQPQSRRALRWIESRFGQKLAVPLIVNLNVAKRNTATTHAARLDGQGNWQKVRQDPYSGCLIEVPAVLAVGKDWRPFLPGYLAHEVVHCFQLQTIGVRSTHRMVRGAQWLADGSADWVAYKYFGDAYSGPSDWTAYIEAPETSLFNRGYDGTGFFFHIARRADNWKVIPAMWSEWKRFFSQPKPFLVAQRSAGDSRAAQDRFLQTWAMSYARQPDLGPDWVMVGTGIPGPRVKAKRTQVTIGKLGLFMQPLDEASVKLLDLKVTKGLVIRVSATGFGAIRWLKPSRTEARFANSARDYCIDCECPDGETLDPLVQKVTATKALVALTGGAEKGFVVIRARSLDDVCVDGRASTDGPDPCIYTVDEATGLIASRVGGHHPVEDVQMQFFPKAPPIPKHVSPPKSGVKLVTACLYLSSFGDAIWVDRLADGEKGSLWDKSLWISYLGYPRDEVLNGTGCC